MMHPSILSFVALITQAAFAQYSNVSCPNYVWVTFSFFMPLLYRNSSCICVSVRLDLEYNRPNSMCRCILSAIPMHPIRPALIALTERFVSCLIPSQDSTYRRFLRELITLVRMQPRPTHASVMLSCTLSFPLVLHVKMAPS